MEGDPAPVMFLVILAFCLFLATRFRRSKTKRRRRSSNWKFWKSTPVSFYRGKKWVRVRDRCRHENNRRYGLGTRNGRLVLRCERCSAEGTPPGFHVDHIWPRKHWRIFQYCLWNTQVLCKKCNTKKGAKQDGHNWKRIRRWRLHPVAWFLRRRQERLGIR